MTSSQIFLYFCLSFILGIAFSSFFNIPWPALLALLIFGLILVSFWLIKGSLAFLGLCLILLTVGIWHHKNFESKILKSKLRQFNDTGKIVVLIGNVIGEPDLRENFSQLIIKVDSLRRLDNSFNYLDFQDQEIEEKVLVLTSKYPEYQYGDKLKIKGELKTPQLFGDFNYQDYLASQGIYSIIFWPEIELMSKKNYQGLISKFYSEILKLKNRFRQVIEKNLSPPQSSLLGAILLGDKRKMSFQLKEKLNITGLRHITAISGFHITILGLIFLEIFLWLGFWRRQALYLSFLFLIIFILMVGAPASAIRAGIMAGFLIFAQSLGRLSQSGRAVIFAGAIILAQNPLLLKSDVGFQLSFLATLGIIYLKDWLEKLFDFSQLKTIIAMTLSAQIFTLPILIYNFGQISLFSVLTNLLILPILPLLMLIGLIFILTGAIFSFLGWLLCWPVWLLLSYIIFVIDFFSKSPYSAIRFSFSWPWLFLSYFLLTLFIWYLKRRQKLKFLGNF